MDEALRDLFRHNAWATRKAIEACAALTEDQLAATLDGTFGAPQETLKHILGAESFYRTLFGLPPDYWTEWTSRMDSLTATDLLPWTDKLASAWQDLLAGQIDENQVFEQERADGTTRQFRAGALLIQAIHHGNVHREQICSIITSLGLEPPDVSAYAYERERPRTP
jgi:uncharacterized damage-inducible protein DinB